MGQIGVCVKWVFLEILGEAAAPALPLASFSFGRAFSDSGGVTAIVMWAFHPLGTPPRDGSGALGSADPHSLSARPVYVF